MKSRTIRYLGLMFAVLSLVSGCGGSLEEEDVTGTYLYEQGGFGGDFWITLEEDGTFTYYEGGLSSYIGEGEWTLNDGTVCLTDRGISERNYFFEVDEGDLVFQQESSDDFIYVTVLDGERFLRGAEDPIS